MHESNASSRLEYENWPVGVVHRVIDDHSHLNRALARVQPGVRGVDTTYEILNDIEKCINWNQQEPSIIQFRHRDQILYLLHSTPAVWAISGIDPLMVDSVVFAATPEEATKYFDEEVAHSDELKEKRSSEVSPLVTSLLNDARFRMILGRGTTFDSRRVTHDNDDVDIVAFVDWKDDNDLLSLMEFIEQESQNWGTKFNVKVQAEVFFEKVKSHVLLEVQNKRYILSIDILPVPLITASEQSMDIAKRKLKGRYLIDMFTHASFLGGDSNLNERLLTLCKSVSDSQKQ